MKIILGSSSKFRKNIFSQVTPEFTSISPEIDEKSIRHNDPIKLTIAIAHAKADAIITQVTQDAIIITADQVVSVNG